MKALQTKKLVRKKSISGAAIPIQPQIKSRPFAADSGVQRMVAQKEDDSDSDEDF
ncbi:MAG: hypothetical protein ICV54_06625, partial [Nostoc sp. C3-bin3]|nr:hypothetical protein [Nostoc sp. C3-bin3]